MLKKFIIFVIVAAFALNAVSGRPSARESALVMCKLPEARGMCRALFPRWRYDPSIGKCREFYFGGCDGNSNNFDSEKACMAVCSGI